MDHDLLQTVTDVLGRAPEWVRGDLASRDEAVRRRAEETLAAMISAALAKGEAAGA
jgi:hypothetical protein